MCVLNLIVLKIMLDRNGSTLILNVWIVFKITAEWIMIIKKKIMVELKQVGV